MGLEPDQQLKLLHEDFTPFAREHHAELVIARDPWHFLELLASSPQGALLALHWAGDSNPQDNQAEAAIVDNIIEIGVLAHEGLAKSTVSRVLGPRPGNKPPLIELVSLVRMHARSFRYPADGTSERVLRYAGCDPVVLPDGLPLSAYRLRFTLTTAATAISFRNP